MPPSKLKEIMQSAPQVGIQYWRIELLQYWLDSTPSASWRDIVTALEKNGQHTLSARLREKYHIPQTTSGTVVLYYLYCIDTDVCIFVLRCMVRVYKSMVSLYKFKRCILTNNYVGEQETIASDITLAITPATTLQSTSMFH